MESILLILLLAASSIIWLTPVLVVLVWGYIGFCNLLVKTIGYIENAFTKGGTK